MRRNYILLIFGLLCAYRAMVVDHQYTTLLRTESTEHSSLMDDDCLKSSSFSAAAAA